MSERLLRTVRWRAQGKDVDAVTEMMHRFLATGQLAAHRRQRPRTRETFGLAKRTLAKQAAKKAGLPQYGVVGPALFDAMRRKGALSDRAEGLLRAYREELERSRDPRLRIVLAAKRRFLKAAQISYSQARPMLFVPPPGVESRLDCSAYVTACYREAGLDDPNGYEPDYPGWGFTGTLWATGRPVGVSQLEPGDLIFYGQPWRAGAAAHVVIYRGGGRAYSHGSESGPLDVAYNYRPIVGCRRFLS